VSYSGLPRFGDVNEGRGLGMDDISVGTLSALAADTTTPRRAIIDTGVSSPRLIPLKVVADHPRQP
jgi:hypothetical protein